MYNVDRSDGNDCTHHDRRDCRLLRRDDPSGDPDRQVAQSQVTDALRHWLWLNFGWDVYEWHPEDVRF